MADPISNPGATPIRPTPPIGPNSPSVGGEGQKPFSPSLEGKEGTNPTVKHPSPMEVASDAAKQQHSLLPPEELSAKIGDLKSNLNQLQGQLQDPATTQKLTSDHYQALNQVIQKMNPDMQNIAKHSQGEFTPPNKGEGKSALEYIAQWAGGSQQTLNSALSYLQTTKKPDVTDYMKLQYSVQRASQRGELFASIIGSTVSGIKTIMSTQLG